MSLVYLSGGITGLTHNEAANWRESVSKQLGELSGGKIKTLSPMRGKRYLDNGQAIERFNDSKAALSTKQTIYTRDRNDTRRSDAILVNLLGATKVSIGTVMEIAWADAFEKPIVVVMEESNIHQHPILNEAARIIVPSLDIGVQLIYQILRDDSF